jgi:dTDP-4-dehydrorhamnose reductase
MKKMKILLTGSQGQLGQSIIECARQFQSDITLISCDRTRLDITDIAAVKKLVEASKPDAMINTAAYTAVDKAESEFDKAFAVNALGPENLAKIANDFNIPMIHFSTDYIFDGEKKSAYIESDIANPIGIYGRSKWAGEEAVRKYCEKYILLRVSWVFGEYGNNFVKSILRVMKERESLNIVSDQSGCPTYAGDIAEVALKLIQTATSKQWGTYHYTGSPSMTRFDFVKAIYTEALKYTPLQTQVINPIKTLDYPTPAKRPQNSVLDCHLFEKVFNITLQPWQYGLKKTLEKISHD